MMMVIEMKLIKITAIWCMSCMIMNDKMSSMDLSGYDVISLDADKDIDEIRKLNVGSKLPIYIIMDHDKEISRLVGEHSKEEIATFLGVNK